MGNIFCYNDSQFEQFNSTSIDNLMIFIFFRRDIHVKDNSIISINLFNYLTNTMDKFLAWYKENKKNQYMPSCGLTKMHNYYLIEYIYNESLKDDADIVRLIKIWNKYKNENTNIKYENIKNNELIDVEFHFNDDEYKKFIDERPKINDLSNNPLEFLSFSRF